MVRWLPDHAPVGDVASYQLHSVEELRVAGGCDCGCASLDFQPDLPGAVIVADALALYPDVQEAVGAGGSNPVGVQVPLAAPYVKRLVNRLWTL